MKRERAVLNGAISAAISARSELEAEALERIARILREGRWPSGLPLTIAELHVIERNAERMQRRMHRQLPRRTP